VRSSWAKMDRFSDRLTRSSLSILMGEESTLNEVANTSDEEHTEHPPLRLHPLHPRQRGVSSPQSPSSITVSEMYPRVFVNQDTHIMIIAMRTILITLLITCHILSKRLFALLAYERHLCRFCERMGLSLGMTF